MSNTWLPLSLIAYLAFSFSGAMDKIIVSRKLKDPLVYSFWVALTGVFGIMIVAASWLPLPFAESLRLTLPSVDLLAIIIASSFVLQLAVLCSYAALKSAEATRIISIRGAAIPIFTLILASVLLQERLHSSYYAAFALLVAGALVMAWHKGRAGGRAIGLALASAVGLAIQAIMIKYAYTHHPFISTFVLFSFGNFLYAATLVLLFPRIRRVALQLLPNKKTTAKRQKSHGGGWVIANAIIGGVGVVAINLALQQGPASIITAMAGIQYAGILLIAISLSRYQPQLLKEELSTQSLEQKLLAITIITVGVVLLALGGKT